MQSSSLHSIRTIGRPHLPTGRSLIGAALITLSMVAAFALANRNRNGPSTRFAVATKAIAPGARIDSTMLELRALRLDPDIAGQSFADTGPLIGSVALGPIGAGQLIAAAGVASPQKIGCETALGHEVTIPVGKDRIPSNLRRGERIAVLVTYGSGSEARTSTTVQQAIVVAFDADGDGIGSRSTARLTLLLSEPSAVLETAHASSEGELTVVRTTQAANPLPPSYAVPKSGARS